jgi:hypothetical protein
LTIRELIVLEKEQELAKLTLQVASTFSDFFLTPVRQLWTLPGFAKSRGALPISGVNENPAAGLRW